MKGSLEGNTIIKNPKTIKSKIYDPDQSGSCEANSSFIFMLLDQLNPAAKAYYS